MRGELYWPDRAFYVYTTVHDYHFCAQIVSMAELSSILKHLSMNTLLRILIFLYCDHFRKQNKQIIFSP